MISSGGLRSDVIIIFIHTRSIINVNILYNIQLLINIKRNGKKKKKIRKKKPHLAVSSVGLRTILVDSILRTFELECQSPSITRTAVNMVINYLLI